MIEYNRQEPPDVQEYYQCEICHKEKHINELTPPDFVEKRIICDNCNSKICENCGYYPIILNGCWQCGAPVCCPKCCNEATEELLQEMSGLTPHAQERLSPVGKRA